MYIAFLRSINVGKINKISMESLVTLFDGLGYKSVKTHLNTGNVIFESDHLDSFKSEIEIKETILKNLDLEIEIIVRSKKEIKQILSNYKFESEDGKNRYVSLLKEEIDEARMAELASEIGKYKKEDDLYALMKKEVNLYIPAGYGKTKLNNKFIEKKGRSFATTRNINTLEKILILMS